MAEKLIKDVIAEADAGGGSPSLVARGFGMVQAAGTVEQVLIQVPNEKVGVIIGKGGETIKNLQTRSGARIQLIPQHLPDGDQSKERTVRVAGDKKQIEMAREMIKEVMNQAGCSCSALDSLMLGNVCKTAEARAFGTCTRVHCYDCNFG
ncbi:far upstream element-binding protein 3-like [Camellia sinensis]|uniref:far upstream element-binding protein 3-like n=1 Tax=Camellia sinensis TaxID=4442 RepID=UPI001036AAA0|nr:far upstream element-binding protein 3-like [Camellia sinensis]